MLENDLRTILATVTVDNMTNGSLGELWHELPDHVAGESWRDEVINAAWNMADYLNGYQDNTRDKVEDMLTDWAYEYASCQVEDYYSNINKRVQDLSLWAYNELDDEVNELFNGEVNPTITDLNSHYLYCATRGLFDCVARWALSRVDELVDSEII